MSVNDIENLINDTIVNRHAEDTLVFNNLNVFFNLAEAANETLKDVSVNFITGVNFKQLSNIDLFNNIELVKNFYNKYNLDYDIDRNLSDGTLDFKFINNPDFNSLFVGINSYDNSHFSVSINNNRKLIDSAILVHELSHLHDQMKFGRNQLNDLFTEALAYYEELVYVDYLKEIGYPIDADFISKYELFMAKDTMDNSLPLLKMLILYNNIGSISKNDYEMFYNDGECYDYNLKILKRAIRNHDYNIYKKVNYVLGMTLSFYLYNQFKDNLKDMQFLHKTISTDNIYNILKSIDLNSFDNSDIAKIINSVNKYYSRTRKI